MFCLTIVYLPQALPSLSGNLPVQTLIRSTSQPADTEATACKQPQNAGAGLAGHKTMYAKSAQKNVIRIAAVLLITISSLN